MPNVFYPTICEQKEYCSNIPICLLSGCIGFKSKEKEKKKEKMERAFIIKVKERKEKIGK